MAMCDIVFITPSMSENVNDESVGTLELTTILKEHGLTCDILSFFRIGDVEEFNEFSDNAMDMLQQRQPKIVSFYTRCDAYHVQLKLAQRIKSLWKDSIYVVLGGPQADITAESTVKNIPYVDYVCCGEGETTVYPFFSSLLKGDPDRTIPGLVYCDNGIVHKNPKPKLLDNLDCMPMLDYSLLTLSKKTPIDPKDFFNIDVGRGCPFACTYCSTKTFWGRKYRLKSPERIVQEVKRAHELFGVTRFAFQHDMFTMNRTKVIEVCELLRTLDFKIEWKCSARLDCLDPELIDIMTEAGLVRVFIGIESGSERMQKLINKNLKLENTIPTLSYLKTKNVAFMTSFIYGFPEETREDVTKTIALAREILKLKTAKLSMHLCAFLPGTELSQKYASELTPAEQYSNITGSFAVDACMDLIQEYPELFTQMWEYKTPLRSELKHLETFMYMWIRFQQVYQYISETYETDKLLDMYYDFVEANNELLSQDNIPQKVLLDQLTADDRLMKKYKNDPYYDIMSDMYRMYRDEKSDTVQQGGVINEIYCFSPLQLGETSSVRDFTKCVAMVQFSSQGKRVFIRPLTK